MCERSGVECVHVVGWSAYVIGWRGNVSVLALAMVNRVGGNQGIANTVGFERSDWAASYKKSCMFVPV